MNIEELGIEDLRIRLIEAESKHSWLSSAKLQSGFIASTETDVSTVTLQRVPGRASVGTSLRTMITLVSFPSVSCD